MLHFLRTYSRGGCLSRAIVFNPNTILGAELPPRAVLYEPGHVCPVLSVSLSREELTDSRSVLYRVQYFVIGLTSVSDRSRNFSPSAGLYELLQGFQVPLVSQERS